MQRQLQQPRTRQQHPPTNNMIRQPRMRLHRQTPRKQPTSITRQPNLRTQQRMHRSNLPNRHHISNRRHIQPIPLSLKSVGREVRQLDTPVANYCRLISFRAVHPGLGKRSSETLRTTLPSTQRTKHRHRRPTHQPTRRGAPHRGPHHWTVHLSIRHRVDGVLHTDRENRVRTHLDKRGVLLPRENPNNPLELHTLTQIAIPINTIQRSPVKQSSDRGGIERHTPRLWRDRLTTSQQLAADLLNLNRMSRVINRDLPGPHTPLLTTLEQLLQSDTLTRDDRGGGTINRGYRHTLPQLPRRAEHRLQLIDPKLNRHHSPKTRKRCQGLAPNSHHPRGVL